MIVVPGPLSVSVLVVFEVDNPKAPPDIVMFPAVILLANMRVGVAVADTPPVNSMLFEPPIAAVLDVMVIALAIVKAVEAWMVPLPQAIDPVPKAELFPRINVPAEMLMLPETLAVAAPVMVSVPVPDLVKPPPAVAESSPPIVSVPALLVVIVFTVAAPPPVRIPEPKLRSRVPVKTIFPAKVTLLLFIRVMAAALLLSIMPLEPTVSLPELMAVALLMFSVPTPVVVLPLYVLFPDNVTIAFAGFASVRPAIAFVLEMLPEMFSVPTAAWVNVALLAAAPPRIIGALIVFVLLVFVALMALDAPVPTFVSVRDPLLLERI